MRQIEAHKVKIRGASKYRVIIPASPGNPKPKHRWFSTREKAAQFAVDINRDRSDRIEELYALSKQDQTLLMLATKEAGSAGQVLESVRKVNGAIPKLQKPLKDAIEECCQDREDAKRSDKYREQFAWTLQLFLKGRENVACSEITADHVRAWLRAQGGAPDTRRSYLSRLRTFFGFALLNGWTVENPAKIVSMPERGSSPVSILTVDQCQTLLNKCLAIDPPMLGYFGLCLFGGLRPSEARRILETDIGGEYVNVSAEAARKKKQRRLVIIRPPLRACLNGGVVPVPANWRKRFRAVVEASGINWTQDVMRHSFVTYHNEIHGWQETVKQAGHSLAMMVEHYISIVSKPDAERFWALRPEKNVQ